MTVLKSIATTALTGLAAFGFASASFARPIVGGVEEGSAAAHTQLVMAIQDNGVEIKINPVGCDARDIMGFYAGGRRLIVICQDNGVDGGPVVQWTANDLDTLRHEAQHMIQDCMVGTNHDHSLSPVYRSPLGLARDVIGSERIARITQVYRENGASDAVLLLEYEAFSVAAMNVPAEQANDIKKYCK